ncbi:MAG: efflux RND transporter periplasmic adaptor subunit [Acidobacteriaceae bacterium]
MAALAPVVLVIGAVLLVLVLDGCGKKEVAATPVVQVQLAAVKVETISQPVVGDAVLAPVAQAAISPKVTAPVKKFYVVRGSRVHKGELLAVLDNADLQASALDSKGSYEQAQAAYNTAVKAQIPADLQTAQLAVQEANANLDVAQRTYDNRKSLFQQGAIPGKDLDTAKAALVQAQSAYDTAKTHFDAFKSVSHADALKAAAGQLASAKGKYENAAAQLAFSEIRSPIDGVVTERPLYAGETAPAGTPLITVMDTRELLAKTHLPEQQAQTLAVGEPATVKVDGTGLSVVGKVSMVSPALDPGSTTIEVWIKVPNKDGKLKAGAPVRVQIASQTVKDALVIPKEAVLTGAQGRKTVMVASDGVAHEREIETGISDSKDVQVVSGLKAGEQVVTTGAYAMADGTKVSVVAPSSGESAAGGDQ